MTVLFSALTRQMTREMNQGNFRVTTWTQMSMETCLKSCRSINASGECTSLEGSEENIHHSLNPKHQGFQQSPSSTLRKVPFNTPNPIFACSALFLWLSKCNKSGVNDESKGVALHFLFLPTFIFRNFSCYKGCSFLQVFPGNTFQNPKAVVLSVAITRAGIHCGWYNVMQKKDSPPILMTAANKLQICTQSAAGEVPMTLVL